MPENALRLTRRQSREVDRIAIEEMGYPGLVLMENAGRGCVEVMQQLGVSGRVLVIAGKGNNAGDGFVLARHLAIRGYDCRVALAFDPASLAGDALAALKMLIPCRVPLLDLSGIHASAMLEELDSYASHGIGLSLEGVPLEDESPAWIVDALLGTGATGAPRPPIDSLIDWMNAEQATKLSLDIPSGLDCDTGRPASPTVRADHTCAFVAAKTGFAEPEAQPVLGQVHVVGIGIPESIIDRARD